MLAGDLDTRISHLRQGEHLCSVYETSDEMLDHVVPYMKYGLLNGEQCIYVAEEHSSDRIATALRGGGIDVDSALDHGRLIFWTRREYRQPGNFDLEVMYRFIERILERGLERGHSGIRLAVEMTWTLRSGVTPEELVRWEGLINKISFPGSKVSFICQYNSRLLERSLIQRAVCVHPVVVLGHDVCPNIHCQPADRVLADKSNGDLEWLLAEIRAGMKPPSTAPAIGGEASAVLEALFSHLPRGSSKRHNRSISAPRTELHAVVEQVISSMPLGVYFCEAPSGALKYYNRAAELLWGRTPRLGANAERFCGSVRLYRADGSPLPHEASPMAEALRKGIVVHDQEVIVERPDRCRRTILVNITPIRTLAGHVIGAINLVQDITERKRSEATRARLLKDLELSKLELQEKIMDLQKFEDVVVGREIKMMQLEKENVALKQRLAQTGAVVA